MTATDRRPEPTAVHPWQPGQPGEPGQPLQPLGAPAPLAAPVPKATRKPPRPAPEGLGAVVSTASVMVSLVSVWAVLQLLLLGGLAHDREQTLLFHDFRVQLAETTAPLGPDVAVGAPVAIIEIPALGVQEVVVEGTASGDLLAGPGHQRGTPLPGQKGYSVVMGRAATYGAPFGRLADLRPGDDIAVVTAQGRKVLEVLGVRREGDPVPAAVAEGAGMLTLISAEGDGRLSALTPDRTLYVDAVTPEAFPTPAGYGAVTPEAEQPMGRDSTALPLLALWLALLLGLSLVVVAARQRWSGLLVWILAGPVALSLAWLTTDTAMRLMPNLL